MKSIKRIGLLMVSGIVALAAFGCSGSGSGSESTTTTSPNGTVVSSSTTSTP